MVSSWLLITGATVAIAVVFNLAIPENYRSSRHYEWFKALRRPSWLTFEGLIPAIWIGIFLFGASSATVIWQLHPPRVWGWMLAYVGLELIILAYMPVLCGLRSLRGAVVIGLTGWVLGGILALAVWPLSATAGGLLVPYLLWSPVGTYVTWEMVQLNPGVR